MKLRAGALLAVVAVVTSCHAAPFYEQSWLGASHNFAFRRLFPLADRTINAFDYGHAILYETLLTRPAAAARVLDGDQYRYITRSLLASPPISPLDEAAIGPDYVQLVPELRAMFDWAHILHRQIYDVWCDVRIPAGEKDGRVAELLRYYKSRPDLALSSRPKAMALMEGQPYSLAFRREAPKFNGLIWSYHWMQMVLYDGMMDAADDRERARNVSEVLKRFHAMVDGADPALPSVMPMTPAIAPRFAARYPEAAVIFDNLHSLHDVVSDILASPVVSRREKRAAILRAAAAYRDDSTAITTVAEWRAMAAMGGAEKMGGVGFPGR